MRRQFIPVALPCLGEREARAARRAILSGWVTQGPEVAAFEREFASFVGARYAVAVSNCTSALHLALLAVGVAPGDEVITVSHSFIATANSIRCCGAVPVFADIDPKTFNMDPSLVPQLINRRTKAILIVHQMGMPCDIAAIFKTASRHKLPVVEDAACALGSEILWNGRWQRIGRPHADVACFSFHPRKVLTTGDGGMLTTANSICDKRLRLWRQHGMSVSDLARHKSKSLIFESYETLGYNYRMTDIQAAVGRVQLKRLPTLLLRRRILAQRYRQLLSGIDGLELPFEPSWARSNWQSFCVRLPRHCSQRRVIESLQGRGVAVRRGIMCAHSEPAYRHQPWSCGSGMRRCACPDGVCRMLKNSEEMRDRCVILPLYAQMTTVEQEFVAKALRRACRC